MADEQIYSTYDESNWPTNEEVFKCRDCGNKYPDSMSATEDVSLCKWCSGELE